MPQHIGKPRDVDCHAALFSICAEKHLDRYLAEFDFRYSNRIRLGVDDQMRREKALRGIVGKRLYYRWHNSARHA